jgi:signal transduction histidine kinase
MAVSNSAGPDRPRPARRSIRFTFTSMVAVPAICMVVAWAVAVGFVLVSSLTGHGVFSRNHRELAGIVLVVAAGMVVVIAALILTGSFARRLSRDITGLATTARRLADEELPQIVERLRAGEQAGATDGQAHGTAQDVQPKTAEVADAAAAIASLQHTAVAAAAAEAGLRDGLRQVFVNLGRRNQSLLQRQLRLIDALEQKAESPAALADLFTLDHLTTRMRRHAESLTILSGAAPSRTWSEPVPVIDVIRGAVAEVEDYKRVTVYTRTEDAVMGPAVADMIHLLAELIENATLFSPSTSRVEVRAERVANGFAIEIDDRGLGIGAGQLDEINRQLAKPPDFDLANADRLGLFVGGRLAARHGVRVSLRPSPFGGTSAIVLMPNNIVMPAPELDAALLPGAHAVTSRPARLDLPSAAALALTAGRSPAERPSPPTERPSPVAERPSSLAERTSPVAERTSPLAERPSPVSERPSLPGQHAGTAAESVARVSQPAAATYRGLPRRTRQASLSPHLRDSSSAATRSPTAETAAAAATTREPEQARNLAASLQSGWQRGREADVPDAQPVSTTETAGEQDSEPLQSEEDG